MKEDLKTFLAYSAREMIDAAKGDTKSLALVSCCVTSFLKYAQSHRLTDDEKAVLKSMIELLSTSVDKYL